MRVVVGGLGWSDWDGIGMKGLGWGWDEGMRVGVGVVSGLRTSGGDGWR